MEAQPREIRNYQTADGKIPFEEWLDNLRDRKARARIRNRLKRLEAGNLGNYRSVGEGVCELKIDFGPGYRVYFGQIGTIIILILCADFSRDVENVILAASRTLLLS